MSIQNNIITFCYILNSNFEQNCPATLDLHAISMQTQCFVCLHMHEDFSSCDPLLEKLSTNRLKLMWVFCIVIHFFLHSLRIKHTFHT